MQSNKLTVLLAAILIGAVGVLHSDEVQAPPKTEPGVALVDMARVFKSYRKFEVLRADLKKEVDEAELNAKQKNLQITNLKDAIESARKTNDANTAWALAAELKRANEDLETCRRQSQKDFLVKESQIDKTIYLEAVDAVEVTSRERGTRLVMRVALDPNPAPDASPQDILSWLNRQVVHQDGLDITDAVLKRLNDRYAAANKDDKDPK